MIKSVSFPLAIVLFVFGVFAGMALQQYRDATHKVVAPQGASVLKAEIAPTPAAQASLPIFTLEDWVALYAEEFGEDRDVLRKEFAALKLPEHRDGFDWIVVVKRGYCPNRIYGGLSHHVKTWKWWENLDEGTHEPSGDAWTYIARFRARIEADEEYRNKSPEQLEKEKVRSITLAERLLLELVYWRSTKKNLDVESRTRCDGSQNFEGFIPVVFSDHPGHVRVSGWVLREVHGLRAREAVR